jgi:hypothetical protein
VEDEKGLGIEIRRRLLFFLDVERLDSCLCELTSPGYRSKTQDVGFKGSSATSVASLFIANAV